MKFVRQVINEFAIILSLTFFIHSRPCTAVIQVNVSKIASSAELVSSIPSCSLKS